MTRRPAIAFWLKTHWPLLRWLPFGARIWDWADNRIDRWHAENGR